MRSHRFKTPEGRGAPAAACVARCSDNGLGAASGSDAAPLLATCALALRLLLLFGTVRKVWERDKNETLWPRSLLGLETVWLLDRIRPLLLPLMLFPSALATLPASFSACTAALVAASKRAWRCFM